MAAHAGTRERAFSVRRILAVMLRQAYLYKRTFHRWLEILYWPALDITLWGFITIYFSKRAGAGNVVIMTILGALILWDILFRAQQSVAVGFLEDTWSRNILNIWASPIRASEYVTGQILVGIIRVAIGASVAIVLGWFFYGFSFFSIGLPLIPFIIALAVMGWSVGVVTTALILRLGQGAEELAWALAFLFQPFSAVFYPVSVLPGWVQAISHAIPASHVFQGLRHWIGTGSFPSEHGPFPAGQLAWALGLDAVYALVAWAVFAWALKQVRDRGLLSRYGE